MKLSAYLLLAAAAVALSPAPTAFCQNNSTVPLTVSPANLAYDSLSYRTKGLIGSPDPAAVRSTVQVTSSGAASPASDPDVEPITPPGFYPADVTNPKNHATVFSAKSHPIYINNPPSHWGNVSTFLTDFGKSDFIHVLDQYVGAFNNNRYTLGTSFLASGYPIPADHTLQITDILTLAHAGAAIEGGGLGHIYHIFIPKGVDMCLPPVGTAPPQCYSPDNPATFAFCAFHSAVTFSDAVGHVLFTVEPYQNVAGCNLPPGGNPNSQLIDSTNDTLSHETSETISDPNLNAWWVHRLTIANGQEIGDLCVRAQVIGNNIYSKDGTVNLNGHLYNIQAEYSDEVHGCPYSTAP